MASPVTTACYALRGGGGSSKLVSPSNVIDVEESEGDADAAQRQREPMFCFLPAHLERKHLVIQPTVYNVVSDGLEAGPAALVGVGRVPQHAQSVKTNGDGACSIHSVFGVPTIRGELYCDAARSLGRQLLSGSPDDLVYAGAAPEHVRAICTSLWSEFTLPVLRGVPTTEGTFFWESLQEKNPALAVEAQAVFAATQEKRRLHECAKNASIIASRDFFCVEIEENLIRPLAVSRGMLPPDVNPQGMGADGLARICTENPEACEFLMPARGEDGFIVGTRSIFPPGGPSCKYLALFDARPEFDALRLAFLVFGDPCMEVTALVGHLSDALVNPRTTPAAIEKGIEFLEILREWAACQVVVEEPPQYAKRAWIAYVLQRAS